MKYWLTPLNYQYLGDQQSDLDIETPKRPNEYCDWINGEWVLNTEREKGNRISKLLSDYDKDLDKLNKAWLAAMIADGVGESARKAVITDQMTALEAQLEIDIMNIIMEE